MKRWLSVALLLGACRPHAPAPPPETLTQRLLREDFTFAQWHAELAREPSVADLAALLDALAAAQQQAPARAFALSQDGEFRQRALRSPEVRAKAMTVFGMTAPEGVPADINQLMHTQQGDNCPTCRMRERMQNAGNGL